jgi:hypothetical protein
MVVGSRSVTKHEGRWGAWDIVLTSVLTAVGAYGILMVVWGSAMSRVFDALGFGAADAGMSADADMSYVYLLQSVIGAALAGWMVLCVGVAAGPIRRRERWAWNALAAAIGTWYVLDTGFSLATGQFAHAVFNTVFAVLLLVALSGVRLQWRRDPLPGSA